MEEKNLPMKKGEIFIWKHNLVHGGSEIKNLNKTRNSIVFHIIDEKSDLFTFENYMKRVAPAHTKWSPEPLCQCGSILD